MSRPLGTEPSLRRGGEMYSSEANNNNSSSVPSQILLQAQDNDRHSDNPERVIEESPNRRYAKVKITKIKVKIEAFINSTLRC